MEIMLFCSNCGNNKAVSGHFLSRYNIAHGSSDYEFSILGLSSPKSRRSFVCLFLPDEPSEKWHNWYFFSTTWGKIFSLLIWTKYDLEVVQWCKQWGKSVGSVLSVLSVDGTSSWHWGSVPSVAQNSWPQHVSCTFFFLNGVVHIRGTLCYKSNLYAYFKLRFTIWPFKEAQRNIRLGY